jgi:hypothetical protein
LEYSAFSRRVSLSAGRAVSVGGADPVHRALLAAAAEKGVGHEHATHLTFCSAVTEKLTVSVQVEADACVAG